MACPTLSLFVCLLDGMDLGGEMMTNGKNQRYRTWEIKKGGIDTKTMNTLKAARVEDARETILPESLNVSML